MRAGLTLLAIAALTAGFLSGEFTTKTDCSPKRGDNAASVLKQCGTPISVRGVRAPEGASQMEMEYESLLVVLHDDYVMTVLEDSK